MASLSSQYINFPEPVESTLPYKPPPKNNNPAVRGAVLSIGAPLVEKIGFVATLLYNNAGFNTLRHMKELEDVKHRFDPTVTPIATAQDKQVATNTADPTFERKTLLQHADGQPLFWSVRDYHNAYKTGQLTPRQVAQALLPLIRRDLANRNEHSVAFLYTKVDRVMAAAEASTKRWAEGRPLGLLDGVPIAMKDEIDLEGYPQQFGSKKVFKTASPATSWCCQRWMDAGAIMMGKTTMHEMGMDTTNNNSVHGTPRNPFNTQYYTGGSSGGSAYAVAMGLVPFALGTDGGGSIRIPSNYCGVYGLKTTHSRVSCYPSPDVAGTTVVAGPIAATMDDLEIAYGVMSEPDRRKNCSAQFPPYSRLSTPRKKILAVPRDWFNQADVPVKEACQQAIDWMAKECGYQVVDISLPYLHKGQMAHALTIMLEACNNFDDTSFMQPANRILMALAKRSKTNDFLTAQKIRTIIMGHLSYLWEKHGKDMIIVTPTTPNAGWSFRDADLKVGVSDGDMTLKNMMYIWMANFTGAPCLQMPVGFVDPVAGAGKVPVGMMGMGIWGSEAELIEWGYEGERYLGEQVEGGRMRSPRWVDLMAVTREREEKPEKSEKRTMPEEPETPIPTVSNGVNGANGEQKKTISAVQEGKQPAGESANGEAAN